MKHRTIVHTIENEGREIEFRISSRAYDRKSPAPVLVGYVKVKEGHLRRFRYTLEMAREIWVEYMVAGWKHTNTREEG